MSNGPSAKPQNIPAVTTPLAEAIEAAGIARMSAAMSTTETPRAEIPWKATATQTSRAHPAASASEEQHRSSQGDEGEDQEQVGARGAFGHAPGPGDAGDDADDAGQCGRGATEDEAEAHLAHGEEGHVHVRRLHADAVDQPEQCQGPHHSGVPGRTGG
jgi:hypothetical protein